MKIGIFFGGRSREREISFAGGRTVYDNLDKSLFEPVPVFVDSLGNFILLNWEYIYKGTIRDFYPPMSVLPDSPNAFQVYVESLDQDREEQGRTISEVGSKIGPEEFGQHFEMAFLALHGPYGEDGNIQGLLEWYGIPYTGAGIFPSALGIDKVIQARLQDSLGLRSIRSKVVTREDWEKGQPERIFQDLKKEVGLPMVIKSPSQGSSIGVSIVSTDTVGDFEEAIEKSLFKVSITSEEWQGKTEPEKVSYIRRLVDIREGIGMPLLIGEDVIHHPEELLTFLNSHFANGGETLNLESPEGEGRLLIEEFVKGREFSCIVIQDVDGSPIALPPTEIIKRTEVYDYRSKYLPGISRKVTPIETDRQTVDNIRMACEHLFTTFNFNVYARIDGFLTDEGKILLNDPNTTSGMLPSSFFFHQAAEIGLNPSQFLTYIVRTSLAERMKGGKNLHNVKGQLASLDKTIANAKKEVRQKTKVAVVMGGFSSERHISVESGRNIYEKLSASENYAPIPVFLTGDEERHELFILPIQVMLKDNADDILEKVRKMQPRHEVTRAIMQRAKAITEKYTNELIEFPITVSYEDLAEQVDFVFIALHGRPGEDGAVQTELERVGLPYNGSETESSKLTINKYETNELLEQSGISVARHRMVSANDWKNNLEGLIAEIEKEFEYPFIAKPADDGCSSAVKKIKNQKELNSFCALMFRQQELLDSVHASVLKLSQNEEFPRKREFLIEDFIGKGDAIHFLEVTGGLVTSYDDNEEVAYEIFEPSEVLASGEVLSLEEKFLAGEGQNITPARFAREADENGRISKKVRQDLEKVAKVMGIQGYARIDAFVRVFANGDVETIVIEINSLPGMTPATCIFHQSAINHYRPLDFIDAIIRFGKERLARKTTDHAVH